MLSKGSSAVFGRARRQPGRWRTADRSGKGLIKVNGAQTYAISGQVAQTYAISQSISKALVAYYHNCESGSFPPQVDAASKKEIKYILIQFGQPLLITDPGHCESIKSGGPDIRALYQKSYQ